MNGKSPSLISSRRETDLIHLRQHVSFCDREGLDHSGPSDVCLSWSTNFARLLSSEVVVVPNFVVSVRNIPNHLFISYLLSTSCVLGNVSDIETAKSISVVCASGCQDFGRCMLS